MLRSEGPSGHAFRRRRNVCDDRSRCRGACSLARTAFVSWRRTGPLDRAPVLARCADPFMARVKSRAHPDRVSAAWVKTAVRYQW